jgi:hypothetical protein
VNISETIKDISNKEKKLIDIIDDSECLITCTIWGEHVSFFFFLIILGKRFCCNNIF